MLKYMVAIRYLEWVHCVREMTFMVSYGKRMGTTCYLNFQYSSLYENYYSYSNPKCHTFDTDCYFMLIWGWLVTALGNMPNCVQVGQYCFEQYLQGLYSSTFSTTWQGRYLDTEYFITSTGLPHLIGSLIRLASQLFSTLCLYQCYSHHADNTKRIRVAVPYQLVAIPVLFILTWPKSIRTI